jgi:hypothetical protein
MQPRRSHAALAVYKKYVAPADSLMETAERMFSEAGGLSKVLTAEAGEKGRPDVGELSSPLRTLKASKYAPSHVRIPSEVSRCSKKCGKSCPSKLCSWFS